MPAIPRGSKLSHFEILEKLGEGGMGVVYKARDLRLDRLVAIKVLPEQAGANADRQARFEQEAKAASALNHPNIITVHEIDRAGEAMFIAMEFVDGKTLDEAISRKGMRGSEALKYAVQITDALAAAHGIGIVHRDLKPANIMITSKGLVKVLDFGLAKLTQSPKVQVSARDATVTMQSDPGAIVGTAAYMSPEQAQGLGIDARSDIFSFGIVLYEMLTGRRPFAGGTKLSMLVAIVNQEPAPVKQMVEELPAELDRIVGRCLRKDPAKRFQTMADLHVALEELKEESESGKLTGPAPVERPRKRAWRWPVVAALVAIGAAGVWLVKRAATPFAQQKVAPLTTYPGSQLDGSFSPDGTQVAFSWDGEKSDNYDIYVKLLGETNALRLTTDPAADLYPEWSPDGKRIAFVRGGPPDLRSPPAGDAPNPHRGIYTTSPLGGAEQKLADFPAFGPMSWSPDGKWLAVASRTRELNGIFLLPADGGEPRRITNPKVPAYDHAPAISRDGRMLAYAACRGAGLSACDIYVQDLDAAYVRQGSPRRIGNKSLSVVHRLAWSRDGESLISDGTLASYVQTYLWRLAVHEARPPQRIEVSGPNVSSPAVAAAGNHLMFSRRLLDYDIWRYHMGGRMEPFIVSSLLDVAPQFSPDGTKIAFASERSGETNEIWVARADGSGLVRMTSRFEQRQGAPRWSPDGNWIAFDSVAQDGVAHIYVIDSGGGKPRQIAETYDGIFPSWSRDGKWIYFTSDRAGSWEVWRAPFAGGAPARVTTNGGGPALESTDGKTVLYMKSPVSSPLFAQPTPGGPERQVLSWVEHRAFLPVEGGIYYIGRKGDDGKYPLAFYDFSNSASRLLTKIEGLVMFGLTVSPDRQTILFSKSVSDGSNLMMIEDFH
jgi:eukaryotic-like serine/threonine-protein kinase